MSKKNTIIINGKHYDTVTGLPVTNQTVTTNPAPAKRPSVERQAAPHHKKQPQRSTTLRRDLVAKPKGKHESVIVRHTPARPKVAKSTQIYRFAPHPTSASNAIKGAATPAVKPSHTVHAAHRRVQQSSTPTATKPAPMSSRELKQRMLSESLKNAQPAHPNKRHKEKKVSFFNKPLRSSSVMAGALAIVILGGYITYTNMPNISTRVAATQAGVEATYPGYNPDGYRFKGPVSYDDGQVTIAFSSNSGPQHYTINQRSSNWDSVALLDSYVLGESNDYTAHTSKGITVYTYQNGAAWVNGGILYTLEGDATLSTEQVLRIANSM